MIKKSMHFAKHTKHASEQICKHPLSMRTLHAGYQLSPWKGELEGVFC